MPGYTCRRYINMMVLPMYKIRIVILFLGGISIGTHAQQHGVNPDTSASQSEQVIIQVDNPSVGIQFDLQKIDSTLIMFERIGSATVTGRMENRVYLEFAPPGQFEPCTSHDICRYPSIEGNTTLGLSMQTAEQGAGKLKVNLISMNDYIAPGKYVIKLQGWEQVP